MHEKNSLSNFERRHHCKFSLVSLVERKKSTVQGRCWRPPPAPVDEPVHRDELAFGRVGRPGGDSPRHRRRPGGRVTPPSTPHRKFRSTSRILTLAAGASTPSRSLAARAASSAIMSATGPFHATSIVQPAALLSQRALFDGAGLRLLPPLSR